ncbi:SDH family Clp fold serine proteinase [Dehalococcoides mccartyi]|uniref:SDH family Clp fold serine proteinase n=1 Tax=Dehalococcoides mccartyi TaxID=61435 RepID=UPI001CE6A140|nr:hypothetical protein [Dehalococcoides mccartyi]QYY58438.1 hypothetical protein CWV2_000342 [Dehalococcoides mccartyi]
MSKNKNKSFIQSHATPQKKPVDSLLDVMQEGREYASLVDVAPKNLNLRDELRRAITEIETVRQHPLLVYAANVINIPSGASIDISYIDDLPFSEMVSAVPPEVDTIDILIVTPGGLAQQVSQFVNRVRPRFKNVFMVIPYMAMSAGTIWALSGNEIWMDQRAFMGPIDPQVPGKDGRFIPAQALLALLKTIQEKGQENLKNGQNPDWSDIMILQNMDAKEIGNALSLSKYSVQLATDYLLNYKFRDWTTHGNGSTVTPEERSARANEVAQKLCSHEHWKVHSHGISREVAWNELQIKINHIEDVPGLQRAVHRFWALLYWIFDNSHLTKIYISNQYSLFKSRVPTSQK